mgnify:CR=1 FL=1
MKLRIIGATNPTQRKNLRDLAHFTVEQIVRPGISKNLKITINLRRNGMEGTIGLCHPNDDSNHLPRKFAIDLCVRQCRESLLQTLAHELVHVKQFAHNELKFLHNTLLKDRWKNKYVSTNVPYERKPWEKEAYSKEHKLLAKWKTARKIQ